MLSPKGRKDGREGEVEWRTTEIPFSKEREKDDLSAFQSPPATDRATEQPTDRARPPKLSCLQTSEVQRRPSFLSSFLLFCLSSALR